MSAFVVLSEKLSTEKILNRVVQKLAGQQMRRDRISLLLIWSLSFMSLSCWVCVADPDEDNNPGAASLFSRKHSIADIVDVKVTVMS